MTVAVFDGHNDVLTRIYNAGSGAAQAFLDGGADGHIDLPRARVGGFAGGLFAIMAGRDPASRRMPARRSEQNDRTAPRRFGPIDPTFAQRYTISVVAGLFRLERLSAGRLKVVRDAAELKECTNEGSIAVVLHFEGAEAIDPHLNALEVFYRTGLRSLGLVWSRPNVFAEGVPFAFDASPDTGPGLTPAGKELVQACNELGIAIDLSHLNARGFWDVAEISTAPLIASHSNAHAICPMTRNLLDDQLDAIAASGGIVGVNFGVGFLRTDGKVDAQTPLSDVVRHFTYLVERMGVDHVGFGSDYDGTMVPEELISVDRLPVLVEALRAAGFGTAEIGKLTIENWTRVLKETWR